MAISGDPFMQGAVELGGSPTADAGFPVRRDVGRIDGAELGLEGQAAGIRRTMLARMTAGAVAQNGQIAAPRNRVLGSGLACEGSHGEQQAGKKAH